MDFSEASSAAPTQTLTLTSEQLKGEKIPLRFVKFQNVSSLQLFFDENQEDSDVTFINAISFNGTPIDGKPT